LIYTTTQVSSMNLFREINITIPADISNTTGKGTFEYATFDPDCVITINTDNLTTVGNSSNSLSAMFNRANNVHIGEGSFNFNNLTTGTKDFMEFAFHFTTQLTFEPNCLTFPALTSIAGSGFLQNIFRTCNQRLNNGDSGDINNGEHIVNIPDGAFNFPALTSISDNIFLNEGFGNAYYINFEGDSFNFPLLETVTVAAECFQRLFNSTKYITFNGEMFTFPSLISVSDGFMLHFIGSEDGEPIGIDISTMTGNSLSFPLLTTVGNNFMAYFDRCPATTILPTNFNIEAIETAGSNYLYYFAHGAHLTKSNTEVDGWHKITNITDDSIMIFYWYNNDLYTYTLFPGYSIWYS